MKVLQISNKIPYPEKDGGAIGIGVFTNSLIKAGCDVKMLAMNTTKHYVEVNSIPEQFRMNAKLETVNIDNAVKPIKALLALFAGKSYNIARFESKEFEVKLIQILQKDTYDVIQMEGIYVAPYLKTVRKHSNAPVIIRAHNVEWMIWQRLTNVGTSARMNRSDGQNFVSLLKKWYLAKLAKTLKEYELKALNDCDGVTTTTVNDMNILKQMGCKTPIAHIPFGIDTDKYSYTEKTPGNSLFYIGALDWLPNLQGIEWFLKDVWDKVHSKFPDVKFHIAGRNMPESLAKSSYPGVVFHGEVESAINYMQEYNIMLVPLLAGSGVRVKIIEGMALGKPIVTTSVGIEGIECTFGKDALVADSPDDFADAIIKMINDKELQKNVALNGRKFAIEHHDIAKITEKLINFYKERIHHSTFKIQHS